MKTILRSDYFQIPALLIGLPITCGIIITLSIRFFFKGLLLMMNHPLIALLISGAFIIGFILGNYETKSK